MKKLIIIASVFVVLFQFLFAIYGFPIFSDDTHCFAPTAYSIHFQEGLVNPFYSAGLSSDGKFIYYPPLFPYLISLSIFNTSTQSTYLVFAFINILTIFCLVLSIYIHLKEKIITSNNLLNKLFLIFLIIAIAGFQSPAYTRPEMGVRLFLSILLLIYTLKVNYFAILNGTIFSLILLMSPISGFNTFCISFLMLLEQKRLKKNFFAFSLAGLVVLTIFSIVYPYHIEILVKGLITHSNNTIFNSMQNNDMELFVKENLFSINNSFGIFLAVLSAYIEVQSFFYFKGSFIRKVKVVVFVSLFCSVFYFAFKVFGSSYNLYALTPIFFFSTARFYFNTKIKKLKIISSTIIGLASISFLRYIVIFIASTINSDSITLKQTEFEINKYRQLNGHSVSISNGMWPFFVKDSITKNINILTTNQLRGLDTTNLGDYLIIQQYGSKNRIPPLRQGYEIIENYYFNTDLKLFGISVAKYPPLHQFCVYKKVL